MKYTYKLSGLECANCAAKMEKAINNLHGVKNVTINFITTKMVIETEEEKIFLIVEAAEKIIKKIESGVVVKKA